MSLDSLFVLLVTLVALYYQIDYRVLHNARFLATHSGYIAAFKYYIRNME